MEHKTDFGHFVGLQVTKAAAAAVISFVYEKAAKQFEKEPSKDSIAIEGAKTFI